MVTGGLRLQVVFCYRWSMVTGVFGYRWSMVTSGLCLLIVFVYRWALVTGGLLIKAGLKSPHKAVFDGQFLSQFLKIVKERTIVKEYWPLSPNSNYVRFLY